VKCGSSQRPGRRLFAAVIQISRTPLSKIIAASKVRKGFGGTFAEK